MNSNVKKTYKINTSNPGKYEEFKRLFALYGANLESTHIDLKEIEADPIQVVAHKASQLEEGVIVEDTNLHVEGGSFGINIRWLLNHLTEYIDHKAEWTVYLAVRQGNEILIYKGEVLGKIVKPRGEGGFGFDPVFLPEGASKTLAEEKPESVNARAHAVKSLIDKTVYARHPIIKEWKGPWQND